MAGGTPSDDTMRAAVLRRLAMLDDLARHGPEDALLPLARTELHRLADGWRMLLTVHEPGENGRCTACPPGLRGRRWPCRVWTMAYQHLIGEHAPTRSRRHTPRRRPRGAAAAG
ncbi:MAG TPA: hypothetical protein VHV74_16555 [Pseudonocardiaceae bacterium]|jgi:hypothetical protein|nr:hypothetical protein [Pseudonocardiaceae bacterium]